MDLLVILDLYCPGQKIHSDQLLPIDSSVHVARVGQLNLHLCASRLLQECITTTSRFAALVIQSFLVRLVGRCGLWLPRISGDWGTFALGLGIRKGLDLRRTDRHSENP